MGYIRKYTTLFLFLLLVVALLSFAGASVFYQKTFASLNSDLSRKNDEIKLHRSTIESLTENYTRLDEMLQLRIQKEEDLNVQFLDLKDVKEELEADKTTLEGDVVNMSASINGTLSLLQKTRFNLTLLEEEIYDLNDDIVELEGEMSEILNDTIYICEHIEGEINLTRCEDYLE